MHKNNSCGIANNVNDEGEGKKCLGFFRTDGDDEESEWCANGWERKNEWISQSEKLINGYIMA